MAQMRYRTVGETDLVVSEIAFGTWKTFSGGIDASTARACVDAAMDAGVTLFDTANVYGRGTAEELLGETLQRHPRDSHVLATKIGLPMSPDDCGLSAHQIRKQVDASLSRLRTEYVDLLYCHRFDVHTPIEETLEALDGVVRAGKVRHLGFSEWTSEQVKAGQRLGTGAQFASSQPQYSMLWRAPETDVFDTCAQHGITQVAWSPLAEGVLTGKYRQNEDFPPSSRAASERQGWQVRQLLDDDVMRTVDRLRPIAAAEGLSMAQLALAWVLRRHEVSSAITGATSPEQIWHNAAASGAALDAGALAAVEEAVADVAVTGPVLADGAEPGVLHRAASP